MVRSLRLIPTQPYSWIPLLFVGLSARSVDALACQGAAESRVELFKLQIKDDEGSLPGGPHSMGVIFNGDIPKQIYYSNPTAKKQEKKCIVFDISDLKDNQALMEETSFIGAMIRLENQNPTKKILVLQYTASPRLKWLTELNEPKDDSNYKKLSLQLTCLNRSNCRAFPNQDKPNQDKPVQTLTVTVTTKKNCADKASSGKKVTGIRSVST